MDSVLAWLNDHHTYNWMMVIDSADNEDLSFGRSGSSEVQGNKVPSILRYIPNPTSGLVLLTSRNRRVAGFAGRNQIHVPHLGPQDSRNLLLNGEFAAQLTSDDRIEEVLKLLGYLPLAISQSSAYMRTEGVDIHQYLEILRDSSTKAGLLERHYYDPRRDLEATNAIFLAWQKTFDDIRARDARASDILSLMAYLNGQSISTSIIRLENENSLSFTTAMGTLKSFDLVHQGKCPGTFKVHDLVQDCLQSWLNKHDMFTQWKDTALDVISRGCPSNLSFESWGTWESILPHAETALHKISESSSKPTLPRAHILIQMASYGTKRGLLEISQTRAEEARRICTEIGGGQHPYTLKAMETLAVCARARRDFASAESLLGQVFRARRKILGESHIEVLSSARSLIQALCLVKKLPEAERLCRQSQQISEEVQGKNGDETMKVLHQLGVVFLCQQRFFQAEGVFAQALQTQRQISGTDGIEILDTLMNLSSAINGQMRLEEAHATLSQALELSRQLLGDGHPKTLQIMTMVASNESGTGKHRAARDMYQQVLVMQRNTIGKDAPATKRSLRLMSQAVRRLKPVP